MEGITLTCTLYVVFLLTNDYLCLSNDSWMLSVYECYLYMNNIAVKL